MTQCNLQHATNILVLAEQTIDWTKIFNKLTEAAIVTYSHLL